MRIAVLMGLGLVVAGCSTTSGGAPAAKQYARYVQSLPTDDINSIQKAVAAYKKDLAAAPEADRTAAFLTFRAMFYAVLAEYDQPSDGNASDSVKAFWQQMARLGATAGTNPVTRRLLRPNGLDLYMTVGTPYLGETETFMVSTFGPYVEPAAKEFLQIRSEELAQPWAEDAALLVSFGEIGDRCLRWEDYRKQFPKGLFDREARSRYEACLNVLLEGTCNSRVLEDSSEGKKFQAQAEQAYADLLQRHPKSKTAAIIAEYAPMAKAAEYRHTPKIDAFLQKHRPEKFVDEDH